MDNDKVRIALIASGTGTDADSIMRACGENVIRGGEVVLLISTKENTLCLEKAEAHGVKAVVAAKKKLKERFGRELLGIVEENGIELVFLVGCIHMIPPLGIPVYNIHPAHPREHGGKGMYGLKVHEHVLGSIRDRVERGFRSSSGKYYTYPTVHEVTEEYDQGEIFLQGAVEVFPDRDTPESLQKRVLAHEWLILPAAVNMAIRRLRE